MALGLTGELCVVEDGRELASVAAALVGKAARDAVAQSGRFHLVLAGGATPRGLYAALAASPARESFPWQGCDLFFGDERCVPPSDPESNFGMVKECLLRHVPMPEQAVHRIYGELEPELAARRYEERLRALGFATQKRFDLVLLGLGSDGHTASLFPNAAALEETGRLVVSARAPTPPLARVTLTLPVINAARQCLFLVSGSEKAQALAAIARGSGATLPASSVVPAAGQLRWLVDRAAASGLE